MVIQRRVEEEDTSWISTAQIYDDLNLTHIQSDSSLP